MKNLIIKINPDKVFKNLLIIIIFLGLTNILGLLSKYVFGHNNVYGLVPLFNLDQEENITNWYSSITILMCSILLGIIALKKKQEMDQYRLHWFVLSLIFLYMSIDDIAQIHEKSMALFSKFNFGDFIYFTWTIIVTPLLFIFILIYMKFFIDLPKNSRFLFFISGIIYVGGVLGMELIDGFYYSINGGNLIYALLTMLEEMLEMLGIAFFIYSLLTYIRLYAKEVTINISVEDNILEQ